MPPTFAERLKEQERRIGCNSREACELLFGLPYRTYMHWLNGDRTPNPTVQSLAIYRLENVPPRGKVVRTMSDLKKRD